MKGLILLLLFFIQGNKASADSNCSSQEVGVLKTFVDETSAQIFWITSDSWNDLCSLKEVNFTMKPEIFNGTCKVSSKNCMFGNLRAFTNYTITIYPIFNEDLQGSPTTMTFFTDGECMPRHILSLEFDDDKVKWLLDPSFAPILDHYVINAEINQSSTCAGRKFPYLENYVLHNESILIPKDVPGEWSICVKPIKKNQFASCENHQCISKHIPLHEQQAIVEKFSLTSGEKSLIAKWSPNSFWSHSCSLDYYQIDSVPSPINHPASFNSTCTKDNCQAVIKHLLSDKNYTIQITPIFVGYIRGNMDSRTETPYNCPSAVTNLNVERNLTHFQLSWSDIYENKADFYEITLFTKTQCDSSYSSDISVNVSSNSFVFKEKSPYVDAKIKITSLKQHDYNCPSDFTEKEVPAVQKITLMLENLMVRNITETSVEITWTCPPAWNSVCMPSLAYKVDSHLSAVVIRNCTSSSCSLWNLKPDTSYIFKVRACTNVKECQESKLSFTTFEIYPNIPDNVFSVDYQDLETFIAYDHVGFHNGNCSIRITDIRIKMNYSFLCTNKGKIMSSDLPSGRKYEIELDICNSRGCNSSKPFIAYSAPKPSELPDVAVTASASNSSVISLKFTNQNGNYNGSLYIVVAEVENQHPNANELETFVRRKSNESAQGKMTAEKLPTRKHIIMESMPLDTINYSLQREFLIREGMETSYGIYVAPVMEYRSGGYFVVAAYDYCGPFEFHEIEQMSIIFWITGSFGSMIGIVFLILMFQRKFSTLPKLAHNGTKKISLPSPTYESSQNNRDLDSECEKQSLNPERQYTDKVVQLH